MEKKTSDPVVARPSATVVLVREGTAYPEILMVRRRAGDAFGDSYAFPGGVVDDDESEAHAFCDGSSNAEANTEFGLASGGLDFYCTAVRELFEETGVLLARDLRGEWAFSSDPVSAALVRRLRTQLNDGVAPWSEILRAHNLRIACDALQYFGFWETPLWRPKRWVTRFFLAEIPPGQDALHDGNELTDSCWITAAEILSTGSEGGMKLPFPTLVNLNAMAGFHTVNELQRWAVGQAAEGITKIRPILLENNGKIRCVIPGDPGYPEGDVEWTPVSQVSQHR
jgi:8-oxo-dGTP pyrophosphatase MutT (NUDIX family)